jgi:hypothetical protein
MDNLCCQHHGVEISGFAPSARDERLRGQW